MSLKSQLFQKSFFYRIHGLSDDNQQIIDPISQAGVNPAKREARSWTVLWGSCCWEQPVPWGLCVSGKATQKQMQGTERSGAFGSRMRSSSRLLCFLTPNLEILCEYWKLPAASLSLPLIFLSTRAYGARFPDLPFPSSQRAWQRNGHFDRDVAYVCT